MLNGIPASIVFQPLPGQKHIQISSTGNDIIVGSGPTEWSANALDAAGYIITGSGAPVMAVSSNGDIAATVNTGLTNGFTVRALASTLAGTTGVTVTANGGSPSTILASTTVNLTTEQELWLSTTAGSNPQGLIGYALGGTNFEPPNPSATDPLDFVPLSSTAVNNQAFALDANGNLWVQQATNPYTLLEFAQQPGANAPAQVAGVGLVPSSTANFTGFAFDSSSNLYITEPGIGEVLAYASPYASPSPITGTSVTGATGVAVAPAALGGLSDSVWVAGSNGIGAFTSYASGNHPIPLTGAPGTASTVDGFDASGNLWVIDASGSLMTYSVVGSPSSATLSPELSLPYFVPSTFGYGYQLGATAQGSMWIGFGGGTLTSAKEYTLAPSFCTANCAIILVRSLALSGAPFGIAVAP